jgi:hypothetical protein
MDAQGISAIWLRARKLRNNRKIILCYSRNDDPLHALPGGIHSDGWRLFAELMRIKMAMGVYPHRYAP